MGVCQKEVSDDYIHSFRYNKEDKNIYWRKTFNNGEQLDVLRHLSFINAEITHKDSTKIVGVVKKVLRKDKNDYEFTFNNSHLKGVSAFPCEMYFNIDFKDQRYRVTIYKIIFDARGTIMGAPNINELLIKKDGDLRKFADNDFTALDKHFVKIFDIKETEKNIDENW